MKITPKKMLLALACLVTLVGCKKQTENSIENLPLANGSHKGIQISLTSDEQAKLSELIKTGAVKDSADFLAKINIIKSQSARQRNFLSSTNTTNSDPNGGGYGQVEMNIASFNSGWVQEINEFDFAYGAVVQAGSQLGFPVNGFKATGICYETFPIRGNQIMFTIPYGVVLKVSSQPSIEKIIPIPGSLPFMSPNGAHWGAYTASPQPAYLQSYNNISANVHAQGSEIRTQIRSTDGKFKISTAADAGIYKAGMELETGFTVTSSQNIYNQYVLDGNFRVALLSPGYNGEMPQFGFMSSLKCTQSGILSNY
jgi:hypothetical protein